MGILDDAIKEHLELKRQHGAEASELKQLEDEAFGAAERPGDEDSADPLAEAPTQFMERPEGLDTEAEAALEAEAPPGGEDEPMRAPRTELADLQEPPPAPAGEETAAEPGQPAAEEETEPAEEESPAIEHEAVPEPAPEPDPEPSSSHTTAEREAIAEHPTEMYDVEAELGPGTPQAPAAPQPAAEEAPVDEAPVEEDPEDFFDEQRLSEELDQALEAPAEEVEAAEEDELAEDEYDEEPGDEGEDETPEEDGGAPEALRPAEGEEDVLEETPDFLEEAPEDDRLWFEQKAPKDFDFDD
jgi:hypothetical protein